MSFFWYGRMLETSINLIPDNLSVEQYFQKTYLVQLEFFLFHCIRKKKTILGVKFYYR